jgi:hypothetical protein
VLISRELLGLDAFLFKGFAGLLIQKVMSSLSSVVLP